MKGKVTCTCGWSWNKSDSSKKDMYICHECGRDNSNNMKNGGWLENYNDSKASAPEGMIGDGYNNVGRDYSPAWGGQFKEGGSVPTTQNGTTKKPLYVDKDDPKGMERYQAFNDSLSLYNYNKLQKKLEKEGELDTSKGIIAKNILAKESKRMVKESNGRLKFGLYFHPFATEEMYDTNASHDIYSKKIKPKGEWQGFAKNNDYSNVKPQQQVIVKPTTTKETTKPKSKYWTEKDIPAANWKKFIKQHPGAIGMDPNNVDKDGYHLPIYADKQRSKVEALQSLQPIGIQNDFNIEASLPVLIPEAKIPKSYSVRTQRYTMEGPTEMNHLGYYNNQEATLEEVMKIQAEADA